MSISDTLPPCSQCGADLDSDDVSTELLVAQCGSCGAVFELEVEQIPDEHIDRLRQDLVEPTPEGIQVNVHDHALELRYRWFTILYMFLIPFTLFWNGFMVVWFAMAMGSGEILMAVFGIPHLLIGVGLGYYTLAGLLNTTIVTLDHQRLVVAHTPIPWRGACDMALEELEQLYVVERKHQGKNGVSYTYELMAVNKDGSEKPLLRGLKSHQAKFMEKRLELAAGITNKRVTGEF